MKPGSFTLMVAVVALFFGGTIVGFKLLTAEAEVATAGPTCENRRVLEGEMLTSNLVTVDIYNASRTAGLADRVSRLLQARNFLPGDVANNRSEYKSSGVLIVGEDPKDPRVRLVGAQFNAQVRFQKGKVEGSRGVAVLVGRKYSGKPLKKKAPTRVKTDRIIDVCVPTAPEV